jgi:hypothetical protein
VRARGDWRGFSFDTTGAEPLDDDEPMVAMIHGVLRARYARAFHRAGAEVVAQAEADPAYTGCFMRCRPLRVERTISGRNPMGERAPVAA